MVECSRCHLEMREDLILKSFVSFLLLSLDKVLDAAMYFTTVNQPIGALIKRILSAGPRQL